MFYLNSIFTALKRNNSVLFVGFIVILFFPFLYLTFFIHPSGDDYSYAFLELKSPFYKAYLDEYFLWNGRYVSNLFVLKNPLTFGFNSFSFYRVIVFTIQVLFFLSINLILSRTKSFFNFYSRVLLSSLFFLFYLVLIPSLNEGFYWYTGLVTYQISIIVSLVYLFLLLGNYSFLSLIFLIFLQFIIIGCNEIAMLYMFFLHLILLFFFIKSNHRIYHFVLFFTSFFFSLIVYFAPGNTVRNSFFVGVSHQFFHSFLMTIMQIVRFVFVLNSGLFLFICAFIFYFRIEKIRFFINSYKNRKHFYLYPIFLFIVLFISIFPAYWSTGIMGQHRTVNFAFFICIPLFFYWYLLIINRLEFFFYNIYLRFIKFSFVILLCSIFFTKNFFGVIMDLYTSNHIKFDVENKKRYELIEYQLSSNNKDVFLKKLKTHPYSISIYDLQNDPNSLVNLGYKRYWKVPGNVFLIP